MYIGHIMYDTELFDSNNMIYIYGAGMYGKKIFSFLEQNQLLNNFKGFIDANSSYEKMLEYPVYRVEEACKDKPNAIFLIAGKYIQEMYRELKYQNVKNIHFILF